MTNSDSGRRRWSTREVVLLGLLGAVLFVAKMAMAPLPNIEPVSLLVIVYTLALGRRALFPIYLYAVLECAVWGISYWSISYLYVWAVLAGITLLLRRMESPVGWAVVSGAFGLCFGALCALVYLVAGGWAFALSWWVSGIPFDVTHCIGNFVLALVLVKPLRHLLEWLLQGRSA